MSFDETDEGKALRASVAGFFDRHFPIAEVRARYDEAEPSGTTGWARAVQELGVTGLVVPEAHGGSEAGYEALFVVLQEAGRVLLPQPLLPTVLTTVGLAGLADEATQGRYLPELVEGRAVGAVVWPDDGVRAEPSGTGTVLNGVARHVPHGAEADLVLVVAESADNGGPVVAVIRGDQRGLSRRALPTLDRSRPLAEFSLDGVEVEVIAKGEELGQPLQRFQDVAAAALAAEQVGGARRAFEMALEYAKTRVAFGQPIGAFQAIKHKLARVFVAVESAAAALTVVAKAIDSGTEDLSLMVSAVQAQASEAFLLAAKENIQVHGGIGFTWEHDAHFYLKRAQCSAQLLGTSSEHYQRIAELAGAGSHV